MDLKFLLYILVYLRLKTHWIPVIAPPTLSHIIPPINTPESFNFISGLWCGNILWFFQQFWVVTFFRGQFYHNLWVVTPFYRWLFQLSQTKIRQNIMVLDTLFIIITVSKNYRKESLICSVHKIRGKVLRYHHF